MMLVKTISPVRRSRIHHNILVARSASSLLSNYEAKTAKFFAPFIPINSEQLLEKVDLFEAAKTDMKDGKMYFANFNEYMATIARNSGNFNAKQHLETFELSKVLPARNHTNTSKTESTVFILGDAESRRDISVNSKENHGEVLVLNAHKFGSNFDQGLVAAIEDNLREANKEKKPLSLIKKHILSSVKQLTSSFQDYLTTYDMTLSPIKNQINSSRVTDAGGESRNKHAHIFELILYLTTKHNKVTVRVENAECLFSAQHNIGGINNGASSPAVEMLQLFGAITSNAEYRNKISFVFCSEDTNLPLKLNSLLSSVSGHSGGRPSTGSSAVVSSGASTVSKMIYTNEFNPQEAVDIVQSKFSVGSNLAKALVSVYGGSLGDIQAAIEQLSEEREAFSVSNTVDLSVYDALYSVFHAAESMDHFSSAHKVVHIGHQQQQQQQQQQLLQSELHRTLTALVTTGFCPIVSPQAAIPRLLAEARLGVVVSRQDTILNFDSSLWTAAVHNVNNFHYALIPYKQFYRLVIHDYLLCSHSAPQLSASAGAGVSGAVRQQLGAESATTATANPEVAAAEMMPGDVVSDFEPVTTAAPAATTVKVVTKAAETASEKDAEESISSSVYLNEVYPSVGRKELKQLVASKELSTLLVADLKRVCVFLGVSTGGTKDKIVARITAAVK